jgi:Cysteine-rich CPCC
VSENISKPTEQEETYRCPCRRYKTLRGRAAYEICKVCFWEDDGQDDHDADDVRGGPNGSLSLTNARLNFAAFGVFDRRFSSNVRPPLADEL